MSEERSHFAQRIDERKFSTSRRGYDRREVKDYLEDLEQAFRELEGHARRTAQRVGDLERDLTKARATERVSVDNAMMAVFDAKDRILERARRKADEIEEEAHAEAGRIKAAALTSTGVPAGELDAARAQADEIIAAARREADRLREAATEEATEDLEAELAATAAQLRRAHTDTASAREELDAARKRIVELESGRDDGPSSDLEQRFAELETHLSAARSDTERLEGELATRDREVAALQEAVAAADQALAQSKDYVADTEAELEQKGRTIAELEKELTSERADLETARAELEKAAAAPNVADPGARFTAFAAALVQAENHESQSQLISELTRASDVLGSDPTQVGELEAAVVAAEKQIADAETTIADLETQLAARPEPEASDDEEADAIIAAAREEAEAIKAEAEEEAEQRAAKVIGKAREEAEQVRETVATLTAQAEDARSAALRSKLEAEDLAEAQRSMSQARDDIVAAAQARADELEEEAKRAAASLREQAEEALRSAQDEAEQAQQAAAEEVRLLLADAEARAEEILAEAQTESAGATEEDLDAMMAQAQLEVAVSEELRHQRAQLDLREQELAERESALIAKQAEAAKLIASTRSAPAPAEPSLPEQEIVAEADEADVRPESEDEGDDDPAERLSTLLEQVAPASSGTLDMDTVDLEQIGGDENGEPQPRMAWPTPMQADDSDTETEEDDEDGKPRESRYRSRSAQLPQLGNQAKSNMTTMANLRKKSSRDG
ncbi:MAG: DivIVA domain-containing protein [Acidimicrobiia bacterium]|nr:DivIVA domain-containing protein [Acidimicrobiia bacterium]